MGQETEQRKVHISKGIPVSVLGAMILQTLAAVWYASQMAALIQTTADKTVNIEKAVLAGDADKQKTDNEQNLKINSLQTSQQNLGENIRDVKSGIQDINRKLDSYLYDRVERKGR